MSKTNETTIQLLNALLRDELAAVETYRQVESKFENLLEAELLKKVARDHQQIAVELRVQVLRSGGEAPKSSGAWAAFSQWTEGEADESGKTAALKALKESEQLGVHGYEAALKDQELPLEYQILIRNTFLPRCAQHICNLNQMISLQ